MTEVAEMINGEVDELSDEELSPTAGFKPVQRVVKHVAEGTGKPVARWFDGLGE